MKWEFKMHKITGAQTDTEALGWVYGPLAYRSAHFVSENGCDVESIYLVTHLKSGFRITALDNEEHAVRFIEALSRFPDLDNIEAERTEMGAARVVYPEGFLERYRELVESLKSKEQLREAV